LLGISASGLAQGHAYVASSNNSGTSKPASASSAPARAFSTSVRDGILTVDGMVAKVGLNYDIHGNYMYFTVPGVGTAVVAQTNFLNAAPQKNAFHGNVLTIQVNGHTVELTSANLLEGKGSSEAWVAFDPLFGANDYPHMGFGDQGQRPYAWPGSKAGTPDKRDANASFVPPPLPKNLIPKPEITSSYSVSVPPSEKK
jgi:hypothetical protein